MKSKVRVYGKSQSRTVLGIINAYLKLYPDSTLSDLQQAFPKSLNPKSFTDNIIVPIKETIGQEKQFFEREDEQIVLKNGERLSLVEVWRKEDYEAMAEHAKQYGIEVAEIEESKPFQKGSYELEYLDDFVPPGEVPPVNRLMDDYNPPKPRKFSWWWVIILILLLLLLLLVWKKCCCGDKCSTSKVTATENVIPAAAVSAANAADSVKNVADTITNKANDLIKDLGDALSFKLPDGQEWKLDKNSPELKIFSFLNSPDAKVDSIDKTKGWITLDGLSFEKGKVKLTPESEPRLKNLAMIMKFFPNSKIKIGGYTDNTGSEAVNMRISSQRAKYAADKVISYGVASNRVTSEGYGPQFPVCPANDTDACKAANRRVDVKVMQK